EVRGCVFAKRQLGGSQPSLLERAEGGGGVEGVMEDTMRTLFLSLVFLFVTAGACFAAGYVFVRDIPADWRATQGTPTFIFRSRFHEPRLTDCPTFPGAFNKGSTPASSVITLTREASSSLAQERMTASPGFSSVGFSGGSFSINDCRSFGF